jgi:HlyD family secretion protein
MIQRSMTWVAVGLVVAVLLAWSFWPRAELVDVAEVTRGSLVVTLDEEGETRVRERFVVSAPVAGHLLRIELDPGDSVVAGETVLAIFQPSDSTPLDPRSRAVAESEVRALEAEVERLKHETERAKAELEFTKRDCQRDRELVAFGVLSKERLEIAELAEKQGVENVDALDRVLEGACSISGALIAPATSPFRFAHRSTVSSCASFARANRSWLPASLCSRWATRGTSRSCRTISRETPSEFGPGRGR